MKKIILLMAIVAIVFSCNESDNSGQIKNELNGEWNLVSVNCLCEPINLETGEHIWKMNLTKNELHIVNNVSEEMHTILETGTYSILVIDSKITILDVEYDFYFENGALFLTDQPESDGPIIKLIK